MKKLLLFLAGGMTALNASAQYAKHFAGTAHPQQKTVSEKGIKAADRPAHHSTARTTASCFTPVETFGSGSATTLPTGWTVGVLGGPASWKWMNVASHSAYAMSAMNSTSAADGWMMFDSDSIGAACGPACSPAGWLQSPMYNCTGQATVRLNFENYYRSFNDSCSIWVSTDPAFPAGSYQVFPVSFNNNTPTNSYTPNPSKVGINITSAAANQGAVYIRFVYYGYAGGSYSWMIDDVCLSDVDPHDVVIDNGFLVMPDLTAYNGSLVTTPLAFVDSVYPLALLSNMGANAETNVASTAQIFMGTTSVYNSAYTYPLLPLDAADTVISFGGYKPTATGTYFCALSTGVTGDADPNSNKDTVRFTVTDTTWQQNKGVTNSVYLYNTNVTPASIFMQGSRFDVPTTSVGDTVSGFAVSFSNSSDTTHTSAGTVTVQLYNIQAGNTAWIYQGTSVARPVSSLQFSNATTTVWTDFRIDADASGGITQFVLQPGYTYAAIVQVNGVDKNLLINATPAMRGSENYIGYLGQYDVSVNDGSTNFGATQATGNPSSVPMVRMYTGTIAGPSSVKNVSNAIVAGKAYPNPANTAVNIPFTTGSTGAVSITLANVVGQTLKAQQLNATSGQQATATFSTADLAAGVYMYTISADGQNTTGRVVVAH